MREPARAATCPSEPCRNQNAGLCDIGELFQECPGARVGCLAQAMRADKGLRRRRRQTDSAGYHIRGSLINLVIGEGARIHPMISDQNAFQTVEDE